MGFTNLPLTNKVTKLTFVNSLIVRVSKSKTNYISNYKMVCNKITFVFVLVGLISISCMVSSAAIGDTPTTAAPTTPKATTPAATTPKATTEKATTPSVDPTATTKKATSVSVDPTATTAKATTGSVDPTATTTVNTGPTSGAGCPKITYGMLFSFISAILLLSA